MLISRTKALSLLPAFILVVDVAGSPRAQTPRDPARPSASASRWSGLDQGLSDEEKEALWFTPQGSMLVPYRWFLEVEEAGSQARFRDDAHMKRLGYLTAPASPRNPDALPIGFVKGRQKQGSYEMLGMTCAACHTTRLELGGRSIQVEGGPSLADFDGFFSELVAAFEATLDDERKLQRFTLSVVGEASGDKAKALRADLESQTRKLAERKKRNAAPARPGHGRIDALGNILNEVMARDLGVPENQRPPDAPVSYPVLWDAHQHDFVQWNGSAPNAGPGPLLRNIGEVLGVFGDMEFTPRRGRFPVYKNASVDVENLKQIETLVAKMQSPLWPASFPAVDREKARLGQALHATHCETCHAPIRRDDPNRRIRAHMVEVAHVGTDPVAAENFVQRRAKTGVLQGTPVFVDLLQAFGETASAGEILRNAVFGVQLGKFELGLPHLPRLVMPPGGLTALLEEHWNALEQKVKDEETAIKTLVAGDPRQLTVPMYKARPHNGLWASAPYLHNGSVPTLWEMLKPPAERVKRFYVGSRQYDPVQVGVRSVESEGGVRYFEYDTTVRGNSNAGHPFGTQLSDVEKRQLIEYLKTL